MSTAAIKMAQWVKCLLQKHEDLSLNPRHSRKTQAQSMCVFEALEAGSK